MNVYKVYCPVKYGSMFGGNLESLLIVAEDEKNARTYAKDWLKETKESFESEENNWEISLVGLNITPGTVLHVGRNYNNY